MGCDILDLKCIFVNELVGDPMLAVLFILLIFIIASIKLNFGFETTLVFGVLVTIFASLVIFGASAVVAFSTLAVGGLLAWFILRFIGNR